MIVNLGASPKIQASLPYTSATNFLISCWSVLVRTYSFSAISVRDSTSKSSISKRLRNSSMVNFWYFSSKYGRKLVTRPRTDFVPFDSIFFLETVKTRWTSAKSTSYIKVPWVYIFPFFVYMALPENFFPSINKSLRPLISAPVAPILCNASIIGLVNALKSPKAWCPSWTTKLKLTFPRSS